ncbi:MAG: hypothetical protein QW334_04125 [Thermofilum sp.]
MKRILAVISKLEEEDIGEVLAYLQKKAQIIYTKLASENDFLLITRIPKRRFENAPQADE